MSLRAAGRLRRTGLVVALAFTLVFASTVNAFASYNPYYVVNCAGVWGGGVQYCWKGTQASIHTNYNSVTDLGMKVSSIYIRLNEYVYVETGWLMEYYGSPHISFFSYRDRHTGAPITDYLTVLSPDTWYYCELNYWSTGVYTWGANCSGIGRKQFVDQLEWGYSLAAAERLTTSDTNYGMFKNMQFKKSNGSWYMFSPQDLHNLDGYYAGHLHSYYSGKRDMSVY